MRPLFAAVAAVLLPLAAAGQPPTDHPFRAAKVGDYATYTMTNKVGSFEVKGTLTNTVTAATDKDVTLEVTGEVNKAAIPTQTQKIDLTKAFDPAAARVTTKSDAKIDKLDEGKEKVTIGGATYETTWTTLKITHKTAAGDAVTELKVWVGKDVPLGLAKMEMTGSVAGMAMRMQMELTESGNKK